MIAESPDYRLIESLLSPSEAHTLLEGLKSSVDWDTSMKARMTACYGESYDESGVEFTPRPMLSKLIPICKSIKATLGFRPTNCLLNFYANGKSTMGFHSDTISYLEPETGIAIVSLGAERDLTFRNKENYDLRQTVPMPDGSLFYMTQETQNHWTHAVKKAQTDAPRISLTFRRILSERK